MPEVTSTSQEPTQQELLIYHQIALASMSLSRASVRSDTAASISFNPARALGLAIGAVITGGAAFGKFVGKPLDEASCKRIALSMVDDTLLDLSEGNADDFLERLCIAFQTALGAQEAAQVEMAAEERATATVQ